MTSSCGRDESFLFGTALIVDHVIAVSGWILALTTAWFSTMTCMEHILNTKYARSNSIVDLLLKASLALSKSGSRNADCCVVCGTTGVVGTASVNVAVARYRIGIKLGPLHRLKLCVTLEKATRHSIVNQIILKTDLSLYGQSQQLLCQEYLYFANRNVNTNVDNDSSWKATVDTVSSPLEYLLTDTGPSSNDPRTSFTLYDLSQIRPWFLDLQGCLSAHV